MIPGVPRPTPPPGSRRRTRGDRRRSALAVALGLAVPASLLAGVPAATAAPVGAAPAATPGEAPGTTAGALAGESLLAPPPTGEGRFDVLVFSKTAGFRHSSIEEGIAAIELLGEDNDFGVTATEDASVFTEEGLAPYDAVVWLSTTGDVLDDDQQAAFEGYIAAGGGYAGIHAASDTEYAWEFYGDLVGAYFASHPAQQTADVLVEDVEHPSTTTLPTTWTRFDEWYSFRSNPRRDVHVLASLDETSYDAGTGAMGDHPIAWCQDVGAGRSWYTAMGHTEESFLEPEFLSHVLGGVETAAGAVDGDCEVTAEEPVDDVVAPTVEVALDPAEPTGESGWWTGPVTATTTADDGEGSGVAVVEHQVVPAEQAGTWDEGATSTSTAPVTLADDGDWALHVRATDEAGNTSAPVVVPVRIDATAPTATLTGVEDGATYGSSEVLPLVVTAEDATSGVASTGVRIDGAALEDLGTEGLGLWTLAPGEHVLTGVATDVAGNSVEVAATVTVEVTTADVTTVVGILGDEDLVDDRTAARALQTLERVERLEQQGRRAQAARQLEILERSVTRTAAAGEGRDVLLAQIGWLAQALDAPAADAAAPSGRR